MDVESSSQLRSMKMEIKHCVWHSKSSEIQPQAPSEIPSESALPHGMTLSVAYEDTGHWV